MDTTDPTYQNDFLETFEVSTSTSTSIHLEWHIHGFIVPFVNGFRVHYQKVASTYVQYGPELSAKTTEYHISNLVADTYYKVCLVTYRNDTSPIRECVDASTTNWQLPVSIGSSIGAILALSMIVLIVLLSRCKLPFKYRKKLKEEAGKYDTMSSNYHDDRYEFSETVTHGHEDDFSSEIDHEESALYDTSAHHDSIKYSYKESERPCANGVPRNYVHPHGLHLGQHRNSTGRTNYHGHHHQRPNRTYSMQADGQFCQPCSPLAKEPQSLPGGQDWTTEVDERVERKLECDEKVLPNQRIQSYVDHSPPKADKQSTSNKRKISQDMFICSQPISDLLFIDDIPDAGGHSARWRPSGELHASHTDGASGVSSEITLEDLSKYGASGGSDRGSMGDFRASKWDRVRALEMTPKRNKMTSPDCPMMDEHTV